MAKKDKSQAIHPVVTVYQQRDHVIGILQQAFSQGVLTTASTSTGRSEQKGRAVSLEGSLAAGGGADLPLVARGSLEGGGCGGIARSGETGESHATSQEYEFSDAYYLEFVRRFLYDNGLVHMVQSGEDAEKLFPGDFVEFSASFTANQLATLLDILTPDLLAEIRKYAVRSETERLYDGVDFEGLQKFAQRRQAKEVAEADLARALTAAARADTRSDATRQYHALICGQGNSALTAVTVCDTVHFLIDDPDRLLDGQFTVLGKVAVPVARDVPLLARNKLLSRIQPAAFDELTDALRSVGREAADRFSGEAGKIEDLVDISLDSRLNGMSFTVLPIAIYL